MQMGPNEILREYNTAANKAGQIVVLAQLNACEPLEIARILHEQGAELPKRWVNKLDEKPAPTKPVCGALTAGVLRRFLERIPEETPIRLHHEIAQASLIAFTESYDAGLDQTTLVLELG